MRWLLLGVPLLLLVPGAGAWTATAVVGTGDVDTYLFENDGHQGGPFGSGRACNLDLRFWEARLTLLDPHPLDRVMVSVEGSHLTSTVAAVATFDQPSVAVEFTWGSSCYGFLVHVTGLLVEGPVRYELAV